MKHLLTIVCSFLLLKANAQQLPTYSLYDLESGTFSDVLFNRKKINPAVFKDSSIISIDFLQKADWIGTTNSPSGVMISLESNFPGTKSGIGLDAEFFRFGDNMLKKQSYELFYKYMILDKNNLKINIGAGFGFAQYKAKSMMFDSNFDLSTETNRFQSVSSGLGGQVLFKNHNLGVAYNNYLLKTDITDHNGNEQHDALAKFTANYSYCLQLNNSLCLNPELVYFRTKQGNLFVLNTALIIKRIIRTGIFADSNKEFGGMFSCELWKFLEFGYAFTYKKDDEEHIRGTHVFKAGFNISKF
jgi:hypothetical protein